MIIDKHCFSYEYDRKKIRHITNLCILIKWLEEEHLRIKMDHKNVKDYISNVEKNLGNVSEYIHIVDRLKNQVQTDIRAEECALLAFERIDESKDTFRFKELIETQLVSNISEPHIQFYEDLVFSDIESDNYESVNCLKGLGSSTVYLIRKKNLNNVRIMVETNCIEEYDQYLVYKLIHEYNQLDIVNRYSIEHVRRSKSEYSAVLLNNLDGTIYNRSKVSDFKYGTPRKNYGEWGYIQEALNILKEKGRAYILVHNSILARTYDKEIRRNIINEDLVEGVITIVNSLNSHSIIVLNKDKGNKKQVYFMVIDELLYVYGSGEEIDYFNQNIVIDKISNIISNEDLANNNYILSPLQYIKGGEKLRTNVKLKDVAICQGGRQLTSAEKQDLIVDKGTHYFLNVSSIQEWFISYEEAQKIELKDKSWSRYEIRENDILLVTRGTDIRASIVEENHSKSIIASNITIIRVDPEKYNVYVLAKYLNCAMGQNQLSLISNKSTVQIISLNRLKELPLPDISVEEVSELGRHIKANEDNYKEEIELAKEKHKQRNLELLYELGLT